MTQSDDPNEPSGEAPATPAIRLPIGAVPRKAIV